MAWIDLTDTRFGKTWNCNIIKMLLDDVPLAGGAIDIPPAEADWKSFRILFVASSRIGTLGLGIFCWAIPGSSKEAGYGGSPHRLHRT